MKDLSACVYDLNQDGLITIEQIPDLGQFFF